MQQFSKIAKKIHTLNNMLTARFGYPKFLL